MYDVYNVCVTHNECIYLYYCFVACYNISYMTVEDDRNSLFADHVVNFKVRRRVCAASRHFGQPVSIPL